MLSESLHDAEYVLYDIDREGLKEAEKLVQIYNSTFNHIYHATMLDSHTGPELSLDHIKQLCDDLIDTHKAAGYWSLF